MVGKVDYFHETRVKSIAAWSPGRIDRLYVDFTGTARKAITSSISTAPNCSGAQAELLQAAKAAQSSDRGIGISQGLRSGLRLLPPVRSAPVGPQDGADREHRNVGPARP